MAHDITQAEPRTVDELEAPPVEQPPEQPQHQARSGWLKPAGIAAVAAFTVGWVAGVRWAWRSMGPRRHRRAAMPR